MRRLFLPLLVLPVLLAGCANLLDTAAATVDGRKIEEEAFRDELRFLMADPRFVQQLPAGEEGEAQRKELARQYLTFLIHQQVVETYAEENGVEVAGQEVDAVIDEQVTQLGGQEAFDQLLERAGVTEAQVRNLFEQQVLRQRVAEAVVEEQVSEEQLRQTYDERALEFAQVHVAHILVSSQVEAERIARQATPNTFADLAQRFSEDTGSAPQGGDLGPQRAVDLVAPFAEAALRIPVGEIGGPVQTEFGFHVIHVIDRQTLSFEQARPQMVQELTGQVFTNWLLERVARSDIRVNPRYGVYDEQAGAVVERSSSSPPAPAPSVQLTP